MRAMVLAIACGMGAGMASAQGVPIYLHVTSQETDQVGQRLISELRDAIRSSPRFRLVEDKKAWPYLKVAAVNVEAAKGLTAVSYSYVYESAQVPLAGAFITSTVQYCSHDRVAQCARAVLPQIEGAIEVLGKYAPTLRKTLQ